jgi:hypothetical protein
MLATYTSAIRLDFENPFSTSDRDEIRQNTNIDRHPPKTEFLYTYVHDNILRFLKSMTLHKPFARDSMRVRCYECFIPLKHPT